MKNVHLEFVNNWKPTVSFATHAFYTFNLLKATIDKYDTWWILSVAIVGLELKLCIAREALLA